MYLLSHNRSMTELLAPTYKNIEAVYMGEFAGMMVEPIALESLYATREEMIATVHRLLTEQDRQFLLAVKRGDADWRNFSIPEARLLPAVQWKLHNLSLMEPVKRQKSLKALERILYGKKDG